VIIRKRYQILFLIFVCLGLYYPTIFNTTLSIDDVDMVQRMSNGFFSWQDLFAPRASFYYRPLLILTFWIDKWLWAFDPTFSLLENVLLHAANTVLVFLITERFLNSEGRYRYLGFCSALIFAVHPIATESINWMSGRTDLLATFFVLLAVLLLHKALQKGSYPYLLGSILFYLCGIMSKEVVIFFFPAGGYLIYLWLRTYPRQGFTVLWKPLGLYAAPILGGSGSYILYRLIRQGSATHGFAYLLDRIPYDWFDMIRVSFKVFGFYIKKLFVPVPLNFAIIKVSDNYAFLGVLAFFLTVWMLYRRSPRWLFLLIAFYLIAPAIIIALTNIAWTPLAERYIYLPSAFFAVGLVAAIQPAFNHRRVMQALVLLMVLWVVPASIVTAQRSLLWQDKEAFYADTLKKSPDFSRLRNEYGVALLEDHSSNKALEQFRQGQSSRGTSYALVNEARLFLIRGEPEKARDVLLDRYSDKKKMGLQALKMLTQIDVRRLKGVDDVEKKKEIISELFDTHGLIYQKTKDPFFLYRSGQLALSLGDRKKAVELFSRAYRRAAASAYYKAAAGKLADKLAKELE